MRPVEKTLLKICIATWVLALLALALTITMMMSLPSRPPPPPPRKPIPQSNLPYTRYTYDSKGLRPALGHIVVANGVHVRLPRCPRRPVCEAHKS